MSIRTTFIAVATTTTLITSATYAADCAVDAEDPFDLEAAQIHQIYECISDALAKGYAKEGDEIASNFRSWTVSSTRPAVAGAHGNRLLQTFANDIAAEQYLKFEEEGVVMPVGSILAKESIKLNKKKKKAVAGPLFIMTKMEVGSIPETADWLYAGIKPNGKPMKFTQSFCHDCHAAYEDQDMLAYPLEEVRVAQ